MTLTAVLTPLEQRDESREDVKSNGWASRRQGSQLEAQNKRRQTLQRKHVWRTQTAVQMRELGAVPAVIADRLGISVPHVFRLLNEQGVSLPRYLDQFEHPDEVPAL